MRLLMISQVYVPDPAAVGQYMAEAAEALAERGWEVKALTADRGYDDPSQRFPSRENLRGVDVQRLPFSSLGKQSLKQRLAGQLSFCFQSILHGVFGPKPDAVLVTTSPPMGGIVGWAISLLRGVPLKYWVMDINPDQALILGKVSSTSPMTRLLEWGNRKILGRASDVIVLDRYMEETMRRKLPASKARFYAMPPWPMENRLERVEHESNPFRQEHQLDGKFVIMYSGNHSIAHPLDTVIDTAYRMGRDPNIAFLFIGGGIGKDELDERLKQDHPEQIVSLPYQPFDRIKFSLSAADVHLVSMGQEMAGIVHPCKYYGAMALGKPIVLLGPRNCHIADVLERYECGWRVDHGDLEGAERLFRELATMPREELERKGEAGRQAVREELSRDKIVAEFAEVIKS
ncbi:MAG: glycosyltransferase family 4 protein [Verrucomicrobiota bacterium]